jgi:phage terminase small subunit
VPTVNHPLTEKLAAFAEHYAGDCEGNGAKAAEAVGCSKTSAKVMAARWLKRADVQATIVNRQAQIANRPLTNVDRAKIADAAERRERLTGILRRAGKHPVAAIKAADILNKMDGLYITKLGDPDGRPLVPVAVAFVVRQAVGAENHT